MKFDVINNMDIDARGDERRRGIGSNVAKCEEARVHSSFGTWLFKFGQRQALK